MISTTLLWNPYDIYTSMISTTSLPNMYVIPMTSTNVYDSYGTYRIFQGLLMLGSKEVGPRAEVIVYFPQVSWQN
jgi:hypothetical protein